MKSYEDFKEVNYNDVSFFKSIEVGLAKRIVAEALGIDEITKTGLPKVSIKDTVPKEKIDWDMRSSDQRYDSENAMEFLVKAYNRGVGKFQLMMWAEEEKFIKAIAFTGRYAVLNEILNEDQLRHLQEVWLRKNVERYRFKSKTAEAFAKKHKWARSYVTEIVTN